MRFPISQGNIYTLANNVAGGLSSNPDIFPLPPVTAETLGADITALEVAFNALTAAEAAYKAAVAEKDAALVLCQM